MNPKDLPKFLLLDNKRTGKTAKFIVVEIDGHEMIFAEKMFTAHLVVQRDAESYLYRAGFKGEYTIQGGGSLDFTDETMVRAYDKSQRFGVFDPITVMDILQSAFLDKTIQVDKNDTPVGPRSFRIE